MFFRRKRAVASSSVEPSIDELVRAGFEHSTDPIFIVVDGVFTFCNAAAVKLFEVEARDRILGRRIGDVVAPQQSNGLTGATHLQNIVAEYTAKGACRSEIDFQAKGGRTFPARFVLSKIPDAHRRVGLCIIEDVTEWKTMQRRVEAAANALTSGGTVSSVAADLAASAEVIATESTSMSDSAAVLARHLATVSEVARHTDAGVHAVVSSSTDLSSRIAEIRGRIDQREVVTRNAVGEAEKASMIVATLSEAATRIDDVVQLINNIAGQTNLLALNATIEAARAGEAGRGFAVVAAEVKNLADQTAKATGDIRSQVGSVQSAAESAVAAIRTISDIIAQVSADSAEIAGTMEGQSAATASIVHASTEMRQRSSDLGEALDLITQAIEENRTFTDHLVETTVDIKKLSDRLQGEVRLYNRR